MDEVTVYATSHQAVRRTADNCRRLLSLLDAFGTSVGVVHIDTPEAKSFVSDLLAQQVAAGRCGEAPPFELPLCFVGPLWVGGYAEVAAANELGTLPACLRATGYAGPFRTAAHNAIPTGRDALHAFAKVSERREAPPNPTPSARSGSGSAGSVASSREDAPPPPEESDTDSSSEGADSALHTSLEGSGGNGDGDGGSDEEDEPPPPPPSDDEEEEEEEDEELPPPPPDEDDEE